MYRLQCCNWLFLSFSICLINRSTFNDIHCCWEALVQENRLVVFVWKIHTKIYELNNYWKSVHVTAIPIWNISKMKLTKKIPTLYRLYVIRPSNKRPPRAASSHTHQGIVASPISLGNTSVVTLPTYKYKI